MKYEYIPGYEDTLCETMDNGLYKIILNNYSVSSQNLQKTILNNENIYIIYNERITKKDLKTIENNIFDCLIYPEKNINYLLRSGSEYDFLNMNKIFPNISAVCILPLRQAILYINKFQDTIYLIRTVTNTKKKIKNNFITESKIINLFSFSISKKSSTKIKHKEKK